MGTNNFGLTQALLLANLIGMAVIGVAFLRSANLSIQPLDDGASIMPSIEEDIPRQNKRGDDGLVISPRKDVYNKKKPQQSPTQAGIGSTNDAGFYFVHPKEGERDFYKIGKGSGTDKVTAPARLPECLKNPEACTRKNCTRPECRPWGHHYDTIYQQRLGPYSRDDVEPFMFLEVGFFNGGGYDTVS